MPSTNILMLQTVAKGLGELKDEMVFVGGSVAELYADNPAASEIRPTIDVDCVVEISSRLKFARLEEKLRAKGFANDTSKSAPICRWIYRRYTYKKYLFVIFGNKYYYSNLGVTIDIN